MFGTILSREIKEGFTSFIFILALALLTLIIPLSAYERGQDYKTAIADYSIRQSIHKTENTNQTIVLTRSVPPLLPLFHGMYDTLPNEIILRSDSITRKPSSEDLRPLDWLFPKIDISLIVGVLITLMAILLGHDAVTEEKEKGTLKLMLSGPLARRALLTAKATGIILLLAFSLVYAVLLYVIIVMAFSGGTFELSWYRAFEIILFTLAAFLTILVFAALGIAVSTTVNRSSVALAVCMAIWVTLVLIWPSLGPYIAYSFWPVPPTQTMQRELLSKEAELIQDEMSEHEKVAAELARQNIGVEIAWQRYLEIKRRWIERKRIEVGQIVSDHESRIKHQQTIAVRFLSASPYGAFRDALGNLCGTGLNDYESFLAYVERYYNEEFLPSVFDSLVEEKPWMRETADSKKLQLQPFLMPELSLKERVENSILPAGILILETGLLIGYCLMKFERYDVR